MNEKPGEPDAFPFAMDADTVHAVIPIAAANKGKTMGARRDAVLDGATAMFE